MQRKYLGIFGQNYGFEDSDGISTTGRVSVLARQY
jgi:hypothetical protein